MERSNYLVERSNYLVERSNYLVERIDYFVERTDYTVERSDLERDTKISRALYLRALFSAFKLVYAFRISTVECTMRIQSGNLDIGELFSLSL